MKATIRSLADYHAPTGYEREREYRSEQGDDDE